MNSRKIEMPELTVEQLRVHRAGEALHRDGASPAGALELLAAIIEDRAWERLVDAKGHSFKGRFRDFVAAREPYGLHFDPDQLREVIKLRHPHESVEHIAERMGAMRSAIAQELDSALLAMPGGDRRSVAVVDQIDNINLKSGQGGTSESYLRRRLRRDHPAIYERVAAGLISASAAAVEAGIRKRTQSVRLDDPESAAKTLRKHMPLEARQALARLLLED